MRGARIALISALLAAGFAARALYRKAFPAMRYFEVDWEKVK
nr:hypothetical protein [uncultured Agathobaculum sp.]